MILPFHLFPHMSEAGIITSTRSAKLGSRADRIKRYFEEFWTTGISRPAKIELTNPPIVTNPALNPIIAQPKISLPIARPCLKIKSGIVT